MPGPADSERGRPASQSRPKVLYVMGAGRSGSTILGVALGNYDGVVFAGELDKWFARNGTPRRDDPRLRSFWRDVLQEVGEAQDVFAGRTGWLERSSGLLDPRKWLARRRLRPRYRAVSQQLYLAVARVAQASYVVDSSHYPLRARELQALEEIDLHLLYLVRDPQSVVASLGRRDVAERRFGVVASNAYLWLTNLLSLFVFLRHPRERRLFVRHEDFVADPPHVLSQILSGAGSSAATPDLRSLRTGVPFHGNRLVDDELVALNRRPVTATHRSLLTTVVQAPWRAVFSRLRPATES
jgi:Sulfotransferase family